jgi:Rrf2 family cysteine metabolism transcriptional repressor
MLANGGVTMKVSAKGRYGLRIMLELAIHQGEGPLLVRVIAERQGLPEKFVHILVGGLQAAGLVRAVRGRKGGVTLAQDPERITALDVVRALEGALDLGEGGLVPEGPADAASATVGAVWRDAGAAWDQALAGHTLRALADRTLAASAILGGYSI